VAPILKEGSGLTAGTDFHLGFSLERIDPDNPTWTFVTTPKTVSGIDDVSLKAVKTFYDGIVETNVPVAYPREAELTKLIENPVPPSQHRAHQRDRDVRAPPQHRRLAAIDAASSKPFGFTRFTPVRGQCRSDKTLRAG
jgi:UDP-N-acetyl-D-glucosamine dehydrogenase